MSNWQTWFSAENVHARGEGAIFLRIAEMIRDEARRGRCKPGQPLPGTRTLAEHLGVNRNTVVAAYRELLAEGWIVTRPGGATLLSPELPDVRPRRLTARARGGRFVDRARFEYQSYDAPSVVVDGGSARYELWGGVPDLRLLPFEELGRAYRRALKAPRHALLNYGDPAGHPALRDALIAMLSATRGLALERPHLLITRGSQMAIELIARAIVRPGDAVAVEALGYPPAWHAFRRAGAELLHIPVDDEGLSVDALERTLARRSIRALYLTPHHQYPTTAVLSVPRRLALLELAKRHRFALVEDDYDHEFHYEGRPLLPLASADLDGLVVYVGSLSKILAPGLRIGFVAGPSDFVRELTALRTTIDRQGDLVVEAAIAELLEEGVVQRHARKMRHVYQRRRDAFVHLLRTHFGERLRFRTPSGGMSVWARCCDGLDGPSFQRRARARGVLFVTGDAYAASSDRARRRQHLRLGYGRYDERELTDVVALMKKALGNS